MYKLLADAAARGRSIDLVDRDAGGLHRRIDDGTAVLAFSKSARRIRLDGLAVGFEPLALANLSLAELIASVADGSVVALAAPASLAAQFAASAGASFTEIGGPGMLQRAARAPASRSWACAARDPARSSAPMPSTPTSTSPVAAPSAGQAARRRPRSRSALERPTSAFDRDRATSCAPPKGRSWRSGDAMAGWRMRWSSRPSTASARRFPPGRCRLCPCAERHRSEVQADWADLARIGRHRRRRGARAGGADAGDAGLRRRATSTESRRPIGRRDSVADHERRRNSRSTSLSTHVLD